MSEFLEDLSDDMVADKGLVTDVRDKVKSVQLLRDCLPDVLSGQNDVKKLRDYVKSCRELENVDFSYEIGKTEDKIRLLCETQ